MIEKDLVLIGGGHSHLKVLMDFIKKPMPNIRITIVSKVIDTPYSGMLPGYIEGIYKWRDINIDLYKLSIIGNFRFIFDEVVNLCGVKKEIYFKKRSKICFDYLSINIGIESDYNKIKGSKKYAIPLKPISKINLEIFQKFQKNKKIGIVGAGAAGIEVSLALQKRLSKKDITIYLFTGYKGLLPNLNNYAKKQIKKMFKSLNIILIEKDPVKQITKKSIITSKKIKFDLDEIILATSGAAPKWLLKTNLKLSEDGFIITNTKFQTSFDDIFAAGDIIKFSDYDIPKAGVYAVKSGKVLSKNIKLYIKKKKLENFNPQKYHLSIIGLANKTAMAINFNFSFISKFNFIIKKIIDERFINKYSLNYINSQMNKKNNSNMDEMMCKGCAAKINIKSIKNSIPSEISSKAEDSVLIPNSNDLFHTVDMINSIVTDPYQLGIISANHSLSDIYASGSNPITAQMILQLPRSGDNIYERDIKNIFDGAKFIFDKNSCEISGGHTMTGEDKNPVVGFSIIGKGKCFSSSTKISNGDALILTEKLGSGLIFAGINTNKIDSFFYESVLNQMLEGNCKTGKLFKKIKPICATDITGFGLANHLINLINRVKGLKGLTINLDDIKTFKGVKRCLKKNVRSTFYKENYEYSKNLVTSLKEYNSKFEILFDPQTVGGIAFIVPKYKVKSTIEILHKNNVVHSIIGRVDNSSKFLSII